MQLGVPLPTPKCASLFLKESITTCDPAYPRDTSAVDSERLQRASQGVRDAVAGVALREDVHGFLAIRLAEDDNCAALCVGLDRVREDVGAASRAEVRVAALRAAEIAVGIGEQLYRPGVTLRKLLYSCYLLGDGRGGC